MKIDKVLYTIEGKRNEWLTIINTLPDHYTPIVRNWFWRQDGLQPKEDSEKDNIILCFTTEKYKVAKTIMQLATELGMLEGYNTLLSRGIYE